MRNGDGVHRPKPPVNGVARRRKLGAGVVRGDGGVRNRCPGALEKVPPDFLRMMKSPAGNGSPHRAVGLIRTVLGFWPGGDADRGTGPRSRGRGRAVCRPLSGRRAPSVPLPPASGLPCDIPRAWMGREWRWQVPRLSAEDAGLLPLPLSWESRLYPQGHQPGASLVDSEEPCNPEPSQPRSPRRRARGAGRSGKPPVCSRLRAGA